VSGLVVQPDLFGWIATRKPGIAATIAAPPAAEVVIAAIRFSATARTIRFTAVTRSMTFRKTQ
jgi:hypothetical protein